MSEINNITFLKYRSELEDSELQLAADICNNGIVANQNFDLHKKLLTTFEGFIQQLDELFQSLRAEERSRSNGYIPEFTSYQDICEKLRLEVLIAIDKLKLSSSKGASYNESNIEFLRKMNNLKYQLSDIRSQYHNAIKDFDFRLEDEPDEHNEDEN